MRTPPNFYCGSGTLDRASQLRVNPAWIQSSLTLSSTHILPFYGLLPLIKFSDPSSKSESEPRPVTWRPSEETCAKFLAKNKTGPVFLGVKRSAATTPSAVVFTPSPSSIGTAEASQPGPSHPPELGHADEAWFALDLSATPDMELPYPVASSRGGKGVTTGPVVEPSAPQFMELIRIGPMMRLDDAGMLAYARGVLAWVTTSSFCSRCGSPANLIEGGFCRECSNPACRNKSYPRTDPAVIMLVTCGPYCLLGRKGVWPRGRYSALAGFVEPGESLEEAVARETFEEAGVRVDPSAAEYHSSQPWPFPASLMLGFIAEIPALQPITADKEELEDARWFHRDWLRPRLGPVAPDSWWRAANNTNTDPIITTPTSNTIASSNLSNPPDVPAVPNPAIHEIPLSTTTTTTTTRVSQTDSDSAVDTHHMYARAETDIPEFQVPGPYAIARLLIDTWLARSSAKL